MSNWPYFNELLRYTGWFTFLAWLRRWIVNSTGIHSSVTQRLRNQLRSVEIKISEIGPSYCYTYSTFLVPVSVRSRIDTRAFVAVQSVDLSWAVYIMIVVRAWVNTVSYFFRFLFDSKFYTSFFTYLLTSSTNLTTLSCKSRVYNGQTIKILEATSNSECLSVCVWLELQIAFKATIRAAILRDGDTDMPACCTAGPIICNKITTLHLFSRNPGV